MSVDTRPPDPHAPPAKDEERGRLVCFVCESDLSGKKAKIKEGDEISKPEKGVKPGLVELRSDGTGFAGGGKNMTQKNGTAFQC